MKRPYCRIGSEAYQLVCNDKGEPCFPQTHEVADINRYHQDYAAKRITVQQFIAVYRSMGDEVWHVFGIFSKRGWNNHLINKEDHQTFRMYL